MECSLGTEKNVEFAAPYIEKDDACPVDWAKKLICSFREQLCGKSLFCREGMAELYKLTEDISEGKGKQEDLELIRELCEVIGQMADCDNAKNIAGNLADVLKSHMDVWETHIRRKRCAVLACNKLVTFYIDASKCNGCGNCAKTCPVDAISGGEGLYHVIDLDACTKCGRCEPACQTESVKKAATGAVLPKLPEQPGAVGSFSAGLGGLKRGLRAKTQ